MSRTVARIIGGMIDVTTLPLSKRQRDKTVARVLEQAGADNVRTILTSRGVLKIHALRSASTASAAERFHEDEPETLSWIDEYIKPGETLWDIGANIGLYSLYTALKPDISVLAFEPSALNFALLTEHIQLNHMDKQISPLCVALGKETKLGSLQMGEFSIGHASNALGEAKTQFREFEPVFSQAIPAFTADDFCKTFKIGVPDHIKLDVDGIEADILAGMGQTLKAVKTLTMEVEGENTGEALVKLEQPLNDAGFKEETSHRDKGSKRNRLYINQS